MRKILLPILALLLSLASPAFAAQTVILAANNTQATSTDVQVATSGTLIAYGSFGGSTQDVPVYQVANGVEVYFGQFSSSNRRQEIYVPGTYRVKRPDMTGFASAAVGITSDVPAAADLPTADGTASGAITTQNLVPAGAATAGSAVAITLFGQNTIAVQVTGTYTGALTPQCSVDGANWVTESGSSLVTAAGATAATITSGTQSIYWANAAGCAQFRMSANAAVTGTAAVTLRASAAQTGAFNLSPQAALITSSAVIGLTAGADSAVATNASVVAKINTASGTNATNAKGSAGRVYSLHVCNQAASKEYVRIYNKATAPTVGTDSPAFIIPVPTGACVDWHDYAGIYLSAGIGFAVTSGATDLDSGSVAAQDVIGYFTYF